ncbi:MAG: hypothetical protein J07HQW2_00855 [Haloquadratum walsbyi J07HQW2]|uniref:Small CPxCG-related zinc finger protein n=1 Tax=Haloquadratum walsbyi J07HQW2 TaxID=1238425 RepID=U1PQ37_9EURY|nr:MAG: hypothetical protein J07HQW2_00855 [Haloquadratum walsbyi J07HQW2]
MSENECVYCGAVDEQEQIYYDVHVRVVTHSDGSQKSVCNICVPDLETVQ